MTRRRLINICVVAARGWAPLVSAATTDALHTLDPALVVLTSEGNDDLCLAASGDHLMDTGCQWSRHAS